MVLRGFTILTFCFSFPALAQAPADERARETFRQESILSPDGWEDVETSGGGGLRVTASSVGGRDAWFVGGGGGAVFNHFIELGGAGYGMATRIPVAPKEGKPRRLNFGYGGLTLGVIPWSASLIHPRAEVLLGAAGLSLGWDERDDDMSNRDHRSTGRTYFVIEPSMQVEVNLAPFVRFHGGVSWRQLSGGGSVGGYTSADLSRLAAQMGIRFGVF